MPLPAFTVIKTHRTLTLYGWVMLLLVSAIVFISAILTTHPFLSASHPLKGQALVVSGWLSDLDLQEAIDIFNKGNNYQILIVSGGEIHRGVFLSKYKTYAELGFASLKEMGFNTEKMFVAPALTVIKDRTYAEALAVRKKLMEIPFKINEIDVFTEGVHTRRSWYLYQLALGENYKVGAVSATIRHYDPHRWWAYSAGVRQTINESIAYIYTRFFFKPE
jgi:hypothetical protein